MTKKYKIGFTAGVFDLLHEGHINILKKAKEMCEYLIVAVTTDELCAKRKKTLPAVNFVERCKAVHASGYADQIIAQKNMDKYSTCLDLGVNAVFVGDDWKNTESWNRLESDLKEVNVDVVYFERTPNISSSQIRTDCKDILFSFNEPHRGYNVVKYYGHKKSVVIPDYLGIYPIVQIEDQAFAFCNIEKLSLGEKIESIGNEAFFGCKKLNNIELPTNIKKIGKAVFCNCVSLEKVFLPDTIKEIPSYLFLGCSCLSDVVFSNGLKRICADAFDLQSPCVLKEGGAYVVNRWLIGSVKGISEITIPSGYVGIADAAFLGDQDLEIIHIPTTLKRIGAFSFDGSKLWKKSHENGIIYADNWAVGCVDESLSITSIVFREGTIGIGDMAFACCRFLRTIIHFENIEYWGKDSFKGCPLLEVNNVIV